MKRLTFMLLACLVLVSTAQAERILFDFGGVGLDSSGNPATTVSPDANGLYWTNMTATPGNGGHGYDSPYGVVMSTVKDTTGRVVPGMTVGTLNFYDAEVWAPGTWDRGTPSNALYPETAQYDYLFTDAAWNQHEGPPNWGWPGTCYAVFDGLDQPLYDVTLFGSRATGTNRTGHYVINGLDLTLDCAANTNRTITFEDVAPGTVQLYDINLDTYQTFYNAVILEMYVDPNQYGYLGVADFNSVPEPATIGLLVVGALGVLSRRRR